MACGPCLTLTAAAAIAVFLTDNLLLAVPRWLRVGVKGTAACGGFSALAVAGLGALGKGMFVGIADCPWGLLITPPARLDMYGACNAGGGQQPLLVYPGPQLLACSMQLGPPAGVTGKAPKA